jgi:DNA-binding MarR family transcriptional regulator
MVDRGPRKPYSSSVATKAGREAWRLVIGFLLDHARQERMAEVADAEGLSPGQLKTLFHLQPGEGSAMRDLAHHWRCDASYVTNLTDVLEARGLVERRAHPSDRRVKMIALTRKGLAVRDRAFDRLAEPPSAMAALTAAEQRMLRDLLRKLGDDQSGRGHLSAAL